MIKLDTSDCKGRKRLETIPPTIRWGLSLHEVRYPYSGLIESCCIVSDAPWSLGSAFQFSLPVSLRRVTGYAISRLLSWFSVLMVLHRVSDLNGWMKARTL